MEFAYPYSGPQYRFHPQGPISNCLSRRPLIHGALSYLVSPSEHQPQTVIAHYLERKETRSSECNATIRAN